MAARVRSGGRFFAAACLLALAGCASCGPDRPDHLDDAEATAKFRCDPDGQPGGRSPFVPRGGDLDACHDYVGGDWR